MQAVFWGALAFVLYVYVGYPLLLAVWARLRPRPHRAADDDLPPVSVVVAACNEGSRLRARLENLLALDYPADRLEVIVVSNGSTDDTPAVMAAFTGPRVRFIELPAPGKARALNAGVAAARHDVLVFADARQRFAPDTIRRLVANLADPAVGAVSGELVLDAEQRHVADPGIGESVGAYWRYEKALRKLESRIDSTVGVTGAVYALRRACWRDLPEGTLLDDVLAPMRAVLAGFRVVFDESARAFDIATRDAATEAARKTRTLAGNYQLMAIEPRVLVPGVNRLWLQFWSHKVGRLLAPFALIALLVSSAALARHPVYLVAFAAQLAFYGLALYGAHLERTHTAATVANRSSERRPARA